MLRRVVAGAVATVLAVVGLATTTGVVTAAPAAAEECMQHVETSPGRFTWVNTCNHPGQGGDPADSGNGTSQPTCTLTGMAKYCIGASACWANVPSVLAVETWPEETRPSPDAIYTYQSCSPDPTGTLTGWSWYTPPTISLADAARQAFGSIVVPAFSVGTSPPGRSVVGVDTWFWAQTPQPGALTGPSALGLAAVAEPDRVEVDPGDGSGTVSCPWVTAASAACAHVYERSSAGRPAGSSGLPSYTARMRLVYDVRFEMGGAAIDIPGVPDTLSSVWVEADVPVAEVQALVGEG